MESKNRKRALVVGGGKFGERAVRVALGKGYEVYLIDPDLRCPARRLLPEKAIIPQEAGSVLETVRALAPDLVVPTAPKHLVAEWMVKQFDFKPYRAGLEALQKRLPKSCVVSLSRDTGILTLSLADPGQVCPEDCAGPRGFCASTGKPRRTPLREIVEGAALGLVDICRVLVPSPLGQGIGALRMSEILSLEEEIQAQEPKTSAIATVSACHGVVYFGYRRYTARKHLKRAV